MRRKSVNRLKVISTMLGTGFWQLDQVSNRGILNVAASCGMCISEDPTISTAHHSDCCPM